MKKWIFIFMVLIMSVFLVGCNSGSSTTLETTTIEEVPTTIPTTSGGTISGSTLYVVQFESNGAGEINDLAVEKDHKFTAPEVTREGYTLSGWYLSEDNGISFTKKWNFTADTVASNIKLYAVWEINQYTLAFESNGGSFIESLTQDYGTEIIPQEPPVRDGFTFAGWYLDEDLSEIYLYSTMPAHDFTIYAKWTDNEFSLIYEILPDGEIPINSIVLALDETIIDMETGFFHQAVLTSKGRIYTWGHNSSGQLGDGTIDRRTYPLEITDNFELETDEIIIDLILDQNQSAAITSSGRLFYWGANFETYSAIKYPADITTSFALNASETIIDVDFGNACAIVLTSFGRVFTWGSNDYGQLGNLTTEDIFTPVDITGNFDLAVEEDIIQVELGYGHGGALTSSGRVFTWGANGYGQLGNNTTVNSSEPTDITPNFILAIEEIIIQIDFESAYSSVLTSWGEVLVWGENNYGQIGDGTDVEKLLPQRITSNFGLNPEENIVLFETSGFHSMAYSDQGRLWCWGLNGDGQLGYGDLVNRNLPNQITYNFTLEEEEVIVGLSLHYKNSSFITSTGRIFVWGDNSNGQLGNNTFVDEILPIEKTIYHEIASIHEELFSGGETITLYEPTREGYVFSGWYLNEDLTIPFTSETMPYEDIRLYGEWIIAT